jgi:hypothetical protein
MTRSRYAKHQLEGMENEGLIYDSERVESVSTVDDNLRQEIEKAGGTLREMELNEIGEYNMFYDVDGDGYFEDIIIWKDLNSDTIVHADFNDLGMRDIVRIPYVDMPHQLYAIGTGEMLEFLQDAADALINMTLDGTHISLLQLFVTKRGSGIGPNEEFYPFKNIQVDDPKADFLPITFPDVGPTALHAFAIIREIAQQYAGVPPSVLGQPDAFARTRATSSGTQFLAQQAGRLNDAVMESVKDAYSEIGQIIVYQLVRNKPEVDLSVVSEEDAERIMEVLNLNVEDIPTRFKFSVKTTEINKTDEAKRQALLTLTQLYSMYGEQFFNLANIALQMPQMQQYAMEFMEGASKLMKKIFESFGEEHTDQYLPYIRDIEMMNEYIANAKNFQIDQVRRNQSAIQPRSPESI